MQDARIAEVDLWRLDLALSEVRVPGLELTKHEHTFQCVKISPNQRLFDPDSASEFCDI